MVEYKLVKYCKLCNKRYVVPKTEARKFYCDKCHARIRESLDKEEKQ